MKYEPSEFINTIKQKTNIGQYKCPFCGGGKFSTPEYFCTMPISQDLDNVALGPNIPTGIIICENCGHIDFFALGVLEILKKEKGKG